MRTYKGKLHSEHKIPSNGILVGGTNTQGRHGLGTALLGLQHYGAEYGKPFGPQGRFYGICTKDLTVKSHPSISSSFIIKQIYGLYEYAKLHPELEFYVPYQASSDNLNAYTPKEMAVMFSSHSIPDNICFEEDFSKLLIKFNP
jgi:hypothetical protein